MTGQAAAERRVRDARFNTSPVRWEIRMESVNDGVTVDRTGRIKSGQAATRIGYRPVGKRGRFAAAIIAAARRSAWGGQPLERDPREDRDAYAWLLRSALLTGAGLWRGRS